MRRITPLALVVCTITACDSAPMATAPGEVQLARSAAGSTCAADPTFVATDEASLHAAAAAALPGDVIAINGTIALDFGVFIGVEDVTLTCATPGSGLAFAEVPQDFTLIYAFADRVAVTDLSLDATRSSYVVYSVGTDGQRTERNAITCGFSCAFWVGTTNAVVADNQVTHPGGGTSGLHLQSWRDADGNVISGIDGTRIEGNTVIALAPAGIPVFGGIRPRDGTGVTVANNTVLGPWSNSVSMVNLNDSDVERNVLEGAWQYGLAMNIAGSAHLVFSAHNRATANRVRDAGEAGFLVRNACYNEFRGNPSLGSTPHAFVLGVQTGANVIRGTAGPSIDDGAFDCDGDGVNDPNAVSGQVVSSPAPLAAVALTREPVAPSATAAGRPIAMQ